MAAASPAAPPSASRLGALIHPDDAGPVWGKCQRNLDLHLPCSNEYRIRTASGQMRWVWDQAHGIYSESGELLFIDGYLSDIAARKKAEEESLSALRTLQVFVDSVPGHVSFVDAGGLYRLVNPGYEEWFGRSRDEIVGRHLDEMHSRQSSEGEVLGFFALVLGVTGRRLRLHVRQ